MHYLTNHPRLFSSPFSARPSLPYNDVDTDQIIPARYLKVTDKNGLAEGLFYEWRYQSGEPRSLIFLSTGLNFKELRSW
jgi:3-isopropylmalate dehydratase small subunit